MFAGKKFVGAVAISCQTPLSEKSIRRLNDLVKTIIESTLIDLDRLSLIYQLEAQLEIIEESKKRCKI